MMHSFEESYDYKRKYRFPDNKYYVEPVGDFNSLFPSVLGRRHDAEMMMRFMEEQDRERHNNFS